MATATEPAVGTPFEEAVDKYLLYLQRDRSPNTIRAYRAAIRSLGDFLEARGMPTDIEYIRREHLEAWQDFLHRKGAAPATLANRLSIAKALFSFLVLEDDIRHSPAERMRGVRQPERLTPILSSEDIAAMRRACGGSEFADKRARAIFELLLDSGLRRQELADLRLDDVDLKNRVIHVRHGKGDKERLSRFGVDTALTLHRYRSARREYLRKNRRPDSEWWWVGHRGRLTDAGIEEAMNARARDAGVIGFHLHRLRHTWANNLKARGMSDESLMALGGWSGTGIMSRYGKSNAQLRALDEYDRVNTP